MKAQKLLFAAFAGTVILVGCSSPSETPTPTVEETIVTEDVTKEETVDAVTTPSIVSNQATLEVALTDSWISLFTADVTTDKELVINSEYTKASKEDANVMETTGHAMKLYTRDESKVTTETFTLTTPKLTVVTQGSKIQGGTFVGDIYVEGLNFIAKDMTIQGNIFFKTQEAMDTFTTEGEYSITGTQELIVE
ncbi:MAG: hypothetical protein ACRCST_10525 [Turicibacter sp.]